MDFKKEILRKCVAHICQQIGWDAVASNAMDTVVHLFDYYYKSVACCSRLAADTCGHKELSIEDVLMSFENFNINLDELSEYITNAEHTLLPVSLPKFPASRSSLLEKDKRGSMKLSHNNGDNQSASEKRAPGNENLSPVKNARFIPEEAEASQYEMKSFSKLSLESGDLKPIVVGTAPGSKMPSDFGEFEEIVPRLAKSFRGSSSNLHSLYSPENYNSVLEKHSGSEIFQYNRFNPTQLSSSSSKKEIVEKPQGNKIKQFLNQSATAAIITSMKKHRKPTIKEAFIAKKKQNKSAKLAVKVDSVDLKDAGEAGLKKKRGPGRKPKKVAKSKSFISDTEEPLAVCGAQIHQQHAEVVSKSKEKSCDSLLEVITNVVSDTMTNKKKDVMMDDDTELGTVNDEILVEIADKDDDSPLSHLAGVVSIPQEAMSKTMSPAKNSLVDEPHMNIDVEEEILPWSDEDVTELNNKAIAEDHLPEKSTGLELILSRNQHIEHRTSSSIYNEPQSELSFSLLGKDDQKKVKLSTWSREEKDKKREKKIKKGKKEKNISKEKKNKSFVEERNKTPVQAGRSSGNHFESLEQEKTPNKKIKKSDFKKHSLKKKMKNQVFVEDRPALNEAYQCVSRRGDAANEEVLYLKKGKEEKKSVPHVGLVESKIKEDFLTNVLDNNSPHKKKKKKGKRKFEDVEEREFPKSKKFKKEASVGPIIPKLTLKFGGATVCGGTASPTPHVYNKKDDAESTNKTLFQQLPAPIKLVIKPFSNSPNIGFHPSPSTASQQHKSRSPHFSPSPLGARAFSPSPDRISIPSIAPSSSRSPSPNEMARLACGPSSRNHHMSPIYSDSPSPPQREEQTPVVPQKRHELITPKPSKSKEVIVNEGPSSIKQKSSSSKVPSSKTPTKGSKSGIVSETVGKITKANGEIIWICPTCGCPDSGTPMIGCDRCDDWYHWICVNIVKEPPAEMNWYCTRCLGQNPALKNQTPGKRGRPAGKGKSKKGVV